MTTVHVIDDDAEFRIAIGRVLKAAGYAVALYESAAQLLDHLPGDDEPSCILLDVRMPEVSGTELQDRLAERAPLLPVVFLTGYGDIPTSVRAMKAGAEDFLTKPIGKDRLVAAIELAVAGFAAKRERLHRTNRLRDLLSTLTPRERQVFELVVLGKLNKQVAFELGTSERTVKAHRLRVMEKLCVHSLAELVSAAERLGVSRSAV
jgi:RNA polymerase sigma factor (sigma-70 family)